MIRALVLSTLTLAAVGCGDGTMAMMMPEPGPPDMALPNRAPTDHPPLWQLSQIKGIGTVVQSAPEVYIVVWPGDPFGQQLDGFVSWLLASDFWVNTLKEYNIGAGKSMGVITMPTPAPPTMKASDFAPIIDMLIANGSVPNPNANTNIAFFVPGSTVVNMGGAMSCTYFGGYHDYTTGSPSVVYSVIDECDSIGDGGTRFDGITKVATHEIAEAASDPNPGLDTGIVGTETDSEIGDLCNFAQSVSYDSPGDATHPPARYFVQRLYSFATAKLGNVDPCQPVPYARPFFNVATDPPVLNFTLPKSPPPSGWTLSTKLEPFAYGDVGEMHWQVISSPFAIEPVEGTVHAGDTILINVQVPPSATFSANEIDFEVESQKAGTNSWPFIINICPAGVNCDFAP